MKYLNLDTALFDTPNFIRANHRQIGTWLMLYGYCAKQENQGIILQCEHWDDHHWNRIIGCTKDELTADSTLWFFRSGNLFLNDYNLKLEEIVKQRRKAASIGGSRNTPRKIIASKRNGQRGGRPKIIPLSDADSSVNHG